MYRTEHKGIMIVGGGILQIPALKKAKELGLKTYLTDGSEQCVAREHADFFHKISTKDHEANAKLAVTLKRAGKIIGVYTQGTDVEYTVAYSAAKAGLLGISPEAALNCNNKIRMRKILSNHGLNDVKFASAKTIERFKKAVSEVGYPCYVKPADNSGSRGVTRLTGDKNLENVFDTAMASCYLAKEVLVESEIPGREYSVDTVLYRGKLYPAGISDRLFLQKEKYAVQLGSRTPSLLPETIQLRMYELMTRAAKTLGVTDGAFKGDLILTDDYDIKIVEVTARTSGGFDSQYRKPLSLGIDILKATIDIACGYPLNPDDLIPKRTRWSSTISTFPKPGIVSSIAGLDEIKKLEGVHKVYMLVNVGDTIDSYINCVKRVNHITSSADTLPELLVLEKKILDTLIIKTRKV